MWHIQTSRLRVEGGCKNLTVSKIKSPRFRGEMPENRYCGGRWKKHSSTKDTVGPGHAMKICVDAFAVCDTQLRRFEVNKARGWRESESSSLWCPYGITRCEWTNPRTTAYLTMIESVSSKTILWGEAQIWCWRRSPYDSTHFEFTPTDLTDWDRQWIINPIPESVLDNGIKQVKLFASNYFMGP